MHRIPLIAMLIGATGIVESQKNLKMLGLLPLSGTGWIGGQACLLPTEMAINDVNARTDILQGYNLTYQYVDTKCDPGVSVYRMVKELDNNPSYVMVLGGGCSVVSEGTSAVSHMWNLTQLSFGSSSAVLSDRKRFPRFFRMGMPDTKHIGARLALMRQYNWYKIATIHQALEFFSVVMDRFVQEVKQDGNITIITQEIFEDDPFMRVQNLKDRDARIIVTAMYEDKARLVLCAAYKVGLYGPKIVWFFPGWYSYQFWNKSLEQTDCTVAQMAQVAEGAFITNHIFKNNIEEKGIAGITVSEFDERFYNHPKYDPANKPFEMAVHQCYDQIWLAALALNCTITKLQETNHPKTLDEFTYADGDINTMIFECMSRMKMTGVTGRIMFTNGGDPDKIVQLQRIQDGERCHIAFYRQDKNPPYYEWEEGRLIWKDGVIPRDSTYIQFKEVVISDVLYGFMTYSASFGMLLACSLFVFNIVFRNTRCVKMSSPNINNILLFGCVLCYVTVFLKTTETNNAIVCTVRDFCFCIGFTITFSSLFSKTWRVYRIFTNKRLKRRTIKDTQLMVSIIVLVALVLLVLVVREIVSPSKMVTRFLDREVYMIGNDAEVRPFIRMCQSKYASYFGWVIYILEGALLSFGAFLAWETRNVKIDALNDSHQIGLCLYNVVILSAVGLTLSLVLQDQVVLMYGITSGCLIIGTTLTQLVIFIPKVRDVKTNRVGASAPATSAGDGGQSFMTGTSGQDTVTGTSQLSPKPLSAYKI